MPRFNQIVCTAIAVVLTWSSSMGQVSQYFNESINQLYCWEYYNMEITTKNTINTASQKKALVGKTGYGSPAHYVFSPLISYNGTGVIEFKHKLNFNAGTDRVLTLYLLSQDEKVVQTLYSHVYRSAGTSPNGNATNVITTSININWTGIYLLKWVWEGTGTGSQGMIDDIDINGTDVSDSGNDNGYGYCRPDDEVYDTVCVGTNKNYKVPLVIPESSWNWDFFPSAAVGNLDSTLVTGPVDSMVNVSWFNLPGDYQFEATEVRPPHNTQTYSIMYYVHVLPAPEVTLSADTVCNTDSTTLSFQFSGTGPWTISYTDGIQTYTQTFSNASVSVQLPYHGVSRTISVTKLIDASGCSFVGTYPTLQTVLHQTPATGPIWRY